MPDGTVKSGKRCERHNRKTAKASGRTSPEDKQEEDPMSVYIGIDWSERKHDVVFMNEAGAQIAYMCISHSLEGFVTFDRQRAKLGLAVQDCVIGIETAQSLFVDYLVGQNYSAVYVLAPNQVRANQGRFRQSGAKDDPEDARLIAEILRTDRGRLRRWQADSLLTRQMRLQVRWILSLTQQVVRLSNQLRAVLLRYYPAALEVFRGGLKAQIALAFILAYPDPEHAQALSKAEFIAFGKANHYPKHDNLPNCYLRLQASYAPTPSDVTLLYRAQAQQLAHLLLETIHTRLDNLAELQQRYRQHPNHAIFDSLPKAGELIGPALLAFFGDDRARFPDPASVQTLAGTAPVTERSGKRHFVHFRFACDKDWRYICQEWAMVLVGQDPSSIAAGYYKQVRSRCSSESHALRCVANRWLAVAWKLWQTNQTYDLQFHMNQRAERSKPR
jgi:transposase